MRIPKQFTLLNRAFVVTDEIPPSHSAENPTFGECDSDSGKLYINKKECKYDRTCIEQTFLHELLHACLDKIGRDKLSKDEAFVDALAAVLHQYHQTNVGEYDDTL